MNQYSKHPRRIPHCAYCGLVIAKKCAKIVVRNPFAAGSPWVAWHDACADADELYEFAEANRGNHENCMSAPPPKVTFFAPTCGQIADLGKNRVSAGPAFWDLYEQKRRERK
jgi:hypothetical protein